MFTRSTTALFATCLLLACPLAAQAQAPLTAQVEDPLLEGLFFDATSLTFAGSGPFPNQVINTIDGEAPDGAIRYKWTLPSGFNLSGVFPQDVKLTPFQNYQTFRPVVAAPGFLELTNIDVDADRTSTGAASSYIAKGPLTILNDLVTSPDTNITLRLASSLAGSPTKVSFFSEVEKVSDTQWAYTNYVENYTDYDIDFEWLEADLSGTVLARDSVTEDPGLFVGETVMGGLPTEIFGAASADITLESVFEDFEGNEIIELAPGNEFVLIANVLTPVPVPAAFWLFASSLGALLVAQRRRRARLS